MIHNLNAEEQKKENDSMDNYDKGLGNTIEEALDLNLVFMFFPICLSKNVASSVALFYFWDTEYTDMRILCISYAYGSTQLLSNEWAYLEIYYAYGSAW